MYSNPLASVERHHSSRGAAIPPPLANSLSDPLGFDSDIRPATAILIRRLPSTTSHEALGSMLLFAGDLIDCDLIRSPYPEDRGYATARARFASFSGAVDAQQKLNGKPNTAKETTMIVELQGGGGAVFERRATIDGTASRGQTSSASSGGSTHAPQGRARYHSLVPGDKISPPLQQTGSGGNAQFPLPDGSTSLQNIFSPTSPVANGIGDSRRNIGKSMINNDATDDETNELIKDTAAAFARNGPYPTTRRATQPALETSFSRLSVSSGAANGGPVGSPPGNGLTSPRNHALQSPISPNGMGGPGNGMPFNPSSRHQYPPINPADQNPPCNTLYVGNLPIDTSEDELKALFSKQRGYKRLCFRTKQNGPMCFVEFEDISFATKALNELYGHPLHNSIKGGIRLSFSKNPLGVRSGQTSGFGPNPSMSPHHMAPNYAGNGMAANGNLSAVSGPPPGLPTPGMVNGGGGYRSPFGLNDMFASPYNVPPQEYNVPMGHNGQMNPRTPLSGGVPPQMGNGTFGREARHPRSGEFSDYQLGRMN
ncbi:hypothetical protein K431DRAFT_236771 [Polychaeton citri CBS 116435]|uniref:RRM domain-containing protein n=1 Tax=Polychaeton citri CBS 116435 TaxID=1314669 RepID=A0A9P4UK19_9PEZI|nr:hypothetical protein K431DRAFT_236771 [Polychaeton citri CBS 116435]